jgi:large subunit ribosomal protein L25
MTTTKKLEIKLDLRQELGKQVQALRDAGRLPGVINENGKKSVSAVVGQREFEALYAEAGRTQPLEFSIDGKSHLGMIKEIDREPVKGRIIHFTIQAINRNEKVSAEIPVHLDEEGDVPARRTGLDVIAITHSFEVEALPHDLPEAILVDGAKLIEVGDRILVGDIKLNDGVELKNEEDAEKVLFIVEAPRVTSEEDLANDEPEDGDGENAAADVPSDKGSEDKSNEA